MNQDSLRRPRWSRQARRRVAGTGPGALRPALRAAGPQGAATSWPTVVGLLRRGRRAALCLAVGLGVGLGGTLPASAVEPEVVSVTAFRPGYALDLTPMSSGAWTGALNLQWSYEGTRSFTLQVRTAEGVVAVGSALPCGPDGANYVWGRENVLVPGGAPIAVGAPGSYQATYDPGSGVLVLEPLAGAPVAHVEKVVTHAGEPFVLSSEGSHDPEGGPLTYLWSHRHGHSWKQFGFYGTDPTITVTIPYEGTYRLPLVVTDQTGLSDTYWVEVVVLPSLRALPELHLRSTADGWGDGVAFSLVRNNTWVAYQDFGPGEQGFKLDVHGDWTLNFGDDDADGIADADGADIPVVDGPGYYRIEFDDLTREYRVHRLW